jgi:hypothetical protein
MGNPNSKRVRRRRQARLENDPNLVWAFGRWMVRTITSEKVDFGNGLVGELYNETWSEPDQAGVFP